VAYLKSKNCPQVPKLKKVKAAAPKIEEPVKIEIPKEMEAPKKKRVAKKKETHTMQDGTVMAGASHPAPTQVAAPAPVAAPAAAPAKKAKRPQSEYNKFMGEQLRAGKTMQQVAAAWKAAKGDAGK